MSSVEELRQSIHLAGDMAEAVRAAIGEANQRLLELSGVLARAFEGTGKQEFLELMARVQQTGASMDETSALAIGLPEIIRDSGNLL